MFFLESWNASVTFTNVSSTPKVADADLHVIQRDEHRLDDRCVLGEVQPFLVRIANVQTKERIPIVARRECGYSVYNWFAGNLF